MTAPATLPRIGWPRDLMLGLRLAIGGGRTSMARLVLGTIGIGLATAVLLVAASVGHILSAEHARDVARTPNSAFVPGIDPTQYYLGETEFRGVTIAARYVRATGPDSPVPPGLARLPGPDEIVLSPALADLLATPDGALLRPRFPQHVIGEIGPDGLTGPQELTYYAGITPTMAPTDEQLERAYSFGGDGAQVPYTPTLQALMVIGVVVLLVPILIMVSMSSRIAGAQRDRRLAALRLVGAGSRQVRRIAAAESLASAVTGLALGAVLFLVFRAIVPHGEVLGASAYTADVTPSWPLVALIVLLVPVLAIGSALFALRRTAIEPLGVVRGGRPTRRRLWWRAVLVVLGVGLLLLAHNVSTDTPRWTEMVVAGSGALLIGVPVLLPWLLERAVGGIRGGAVSWQLAIRRLQLDSGTPARVVGGVAVVLAGAIALQTVAAAVADRLQLPADQVSQPGEYSVRIDGSIATGAKAALTHAPVVRSVSTLSELFMSPDPTRADPDIQSFEVADCTTIRALTTARNCRDGDVFTHSFRGETGPPPGTKLTVVALPTQGTGQVATYGQWTVPNRLAPFVFRADMVVGVGGLLMITPGALTGVRVPPAQDVSALVTVDPTLPDGIEYVRNALAAYPIQTWVYSFGDAASLTVDQRTFVAVRNGLLIGSLFTLLLAGVSLLVLALEQVRERRRALAMQSASGVPRTVLARSLLWQTALPVAIGVVAAVATGIGLAWLVLRMTSTSMVLDWSDITVFCAAAVVLVLFVTAATLPALRNATRLSALRTE